MKVLVAEDDAITRTTLAENLKSWGYEPVVAEDGDTAWAILEREDAPRLALLDWVLPGMSGIQICRRLRQGKQARFCYIIMLTGKITAEDVQDGFEAGADDYVIKPFKGPALRARVLAGARILEMLDREKQEPGGTIPPEFQRPSPGIGKESRARILIAEDDPISRKVLSENLTGWGYEVIETRDGSEAWKVLDSEDPPRIAVLDQMMPGMSGTEVCRRVRERNHRQPLYIVLLTALGETEHVVSGLEAGADDYLIKPFPGPELRARITVGVRRVQLQVDLANRAARAEADYRSIVENALEGIYQVAPGGGSSPPTLTSRGSSAMTTPKT